jgi:hypothetical protein
MNDKIIIAYTSIANELLISAYGNYILVDAIDFIEAAKAFIEVIEKKENNA